MPKQFVGKTYAKIGANDAVLFCGAKKNDSAKIAHDFCEDELNETRKERVEMHIKKGDYFRTLAAILNVLLVDKTLDKNKVMQNLVCDLLYLQAKYKVVKKV